MVGLRIALGWLLGITSIWLILNGALVVVRTFGRVQGTEFSMLITLVNIVAGMTVWLGFFALWRMIPNANSRPEADES